MGPLKLLLTSYIGKSLQLPSPKIYFVRIHKTSILYDVKQVIDYNYETRNVEEKNI